MSEQGVLDVRAVFAADRGVVLDKTDEELRPIVEEGLQALIDGKHDWYDDIVDGAAVLWSETFDAEHGRNPTSTELAQFQSDMADALDLTSTPDTVEDAQVDRITSWCSTYAVNAATTALGGDLEWVTRHDPEVRSTHKAVDGERRGSDGVWSVGGYDLHFPGEPVGPPAVWISCRCLARRVKEDEMDQITAAAAAVDETDVQPPDWSDDMDTTVSWHGVVAPVGAMSGDRRKFAQMLRSRDLPLPLRWQKSDAEGHDGSVVVANIEALSHDPETNLIKASGRFHTSPESDEAIGLVANQMLRGVSVDLDDVSVELQNEDGTAFDMDTAGPDSRPVQVITDGRIASAALVAIPAFQEAWIALGPWPDQDDEGLAAAGCAPCEAMDIAEEWVGTQGSYAVSESSWDGSASRFDDQQWQNSCVLDKGGDGSAKSRYGLPIKEPNGDLSRAGVHAAAGRLNQVDASDSAKAAAKRKLLAAYRTLKEDPPEGLTASAFVDLVDAPQVVLVTEASQELAAGGGLAVFAPGTHDGPGWVTHPRDSQRLRDYWTHGEGAAKVRWGEPGDFDRCRQHLAKYVPNPAWLAGTCANLHKVAIKIWPGQEDGGRSGHGAQDVLTAAAFTEVIEDTYPTPPAAWFKDPGLAGPTPLTIQDTGRVFGHLALWGSCHIGYGLSVGDGDGCTQVPSSPSGYAYYNVAAVLCDDGSLANVGHITLGTGHAPGRMAAVPAAAHYDNTGSVIADVSAGEDEHGVWVAGWVRPGASEEQVAALRGATLSGDWRTVRDHLELVAALAVNTPGFPVPRLSVAASGGRTRALVGAGVVEPVAPPVPSGSGGSVSLDVVGAEEFGERVARSFAHALRAQTQRGAQADAAKARLRAVRAAQARERLHR